VDPASRISWWRKRAARRCNARAGLLRCADGGVLFLDEIGELGQDEQAMLLKAIEDKRFLPFGGDEETTSDFQLIAGTHRNLRQRVHSGAFREDLYARINLWTFALPALCERPEDIAPNLDYELERHAERAGTQARFSVEARRRYLDFACSTAARWPGNFRELASSITRLATLAHNGRITEIEVDEEIARLREAWQDVGNTDNRDSTRHARPGDADLGRRDAESFASDTPDDLVQAVLGAEAARDLDLFDRSQLQSVLQTCRRAPNLSAAGRALFAQSRQQKTRPNDADRLRKYLLRFGLDWEKVQQAAGPRTQ
jgi:transcriptional regulatory protein RtcR